MNFADSAIAAFVFSSINSKTPQTRLAGNDLSENRKIQKFENQLLSEFW